MRDFVEAEKYLHMAVQNLALYAQRLGKLFASASTWYKMIQQRGWKRPRKRVHPAKPKEGLRAMRPNELLAARRHRDPTDHWHPNLPTGGDRQLQPKGSRLAG
jgi:hypothetical protein